MSADTLSGIPGMGFIYETKKKKTKLEESFQGIRSRLSEFLLSTDCGYCPGRAAPTQVRRSTLTLNSGLKSMSR